MGKFIDLAGQKFGRLVVVERAEKPENLKTEGSYWKCKCDCGNNKIIIGGNLRNGSIKSCGCLRVEMARKSSTKSYGVASFNNVYYKYKKSARYRGYSFELTKNYFAKITKQNCYYCGIEPGQVEKNRVGNGNYIYNGIDRFDNSLGYTEENTVACCGNCNMAKRTMSYQDFLSWIERVYNHSIKGKE